MANLFKQSHSKQKGKTSLTERGASKKGNARANAQVAGLRFGKSKNAADTSESQKTNTVTIEDLDWMGNGVVRGNPMVFVEGGCFPSVLRPGRVWKKDNNEAGNLQI